jgi:hypothetical protein
VHFGRILSTVAATLIGSVAAPAPPDPARQAVDGEGEGKKQGR